ncbi:hypothetical protein B0T21DRAFT_343696 [Apiosordaria backusii]|uniref:Uncharacterized protein n=1 Tax=Apiosordaria backusii TaxID=314023 RepID=A0AA40EYN7_9PEZI|nr:hypothetical protein B0T21DRAFT_343696 [Apiosordaria backusii]
MCRAGSEPREQTPRHRMNEHQMDAVSRARYQEVDAEFSQTPECRIRTVELSFQLGNENLRKLQYLASAAVKFMYTTLDFTDPDDESKSAQNKEQQTRRRKLLRGIKEALNLREGREGSIAMALHRILTLASTRAAASGWACSQTVPATQRAHVVVRDDPLLKEGKPGGSHREIRIPAVNFLFESQFNAFTRRFIPSVDLFAKPRRALLNVTFLWSGGAQRREKTRR